MFAFIERLILLAVAISVVRSLLRFVSTLWRQSFSPRQTSPQHSGPNSRAQEPATMLQCDPVCGTYVAVDSSLKKISNGKVFHFCSPECRERFTG